MVKERRVPEVLWKVYKNRVRTLADTIVSLMPPAPSSSLECRCKGRRCLSCSGADAFSFLLRPEDPSEYKELLLECFVVVSENAPPIPVFCPDRRWSQRQIARKTIEMIMGDSSMPANAICNDYNKFTNSSRVMDLLSTSAWSLLLMRIGDDFMFHLFKFTSIFLSHLHENHRQVAGSPISDLCPKFSKHASESACPQPLSVQPGPYKKRKISDNEDTFESEILCPQRPLGSDSTLSSVTCNVGCNHRNCDSQLHLQHSTEDHQVCSSDVNILNTTTIIDSKEKSDVELQKKVNLIHTKSKKRSRPCSWLRRRKRRQLRQGNHAEYNLLTSCISTDNEEKCLSEKLQHNSNTNSSYTNDKERSHLESETQHTLDIRSKMNPPYKRSFNLETSKHSQEQFKACSASQLAEVSECLELFRLHLHNEDIILRKRFIPRPHLMMLPLTSWFQLLAFPVLHNKSGHAGVLRVDWRFNRSSLAKLVVLNHFYLGKACFLMSSQCFCHLLLQAPQKIAKGTEIDRKLMFHNSNNFSSPFPRNHILNTLLPNDTGAIQLMKDMFCLSVGNTITQSMGCLPSCSSCLLGCACQHQSVLKLFKILIRRARGCQYLKLLDKHCAVPEMVPFAKEEVGSRIEDGESPTKLLKKRHDGFQQEFCLSPVKSYDPVNRLQRKQQKRTLEACDRQLQSSGSYCRKSQVVSFVWAVCRSIVPPDLLGAPSEWRALRRNISKFIQLRRFEIFCLKHCMHGLKTSSFTLLPNKHSSCSLSNGMVEVLLGKDANMLTGFDKVRNAKSTLENKLFECWIYWFFSSLVVPVLQTNFYITESEGGRLDIFYFRKPIWKHLTTKAVADLTQQSYRLLDDKLLRSILSKRNFGFSKVRFSPKENGLRALANLKAPSKIPIRNKRPLPELSVREQFNRVQRKVGKFHHFKPVNCALQDLTVVLKGIRMNHPENLGSSVFDYNDVYRKLSPFLICLKNRYKTIPSVYVVTCDVSQAFDSIDQDKLLMAMKDVMLKDEYLIKRSSKVVCTKTSTWVNYDQILLDQSSAIKISTAPVPFLSFNSVFTNQETTRQIRKDELYRVLCEHVKRNVLQVDQNFYLQQVGIPQGSIVSSLLCCFYYAHLERNVLFPFLENITHSSGVAKGNLSEKHTCQDVASAENGVKDDIPVSPDHLLLRYIDDFLFISTSEKLAASFFSRLERGFREYNFFINEAKSCMNFGVGRISGFSSNKVYIGEDGISFLPWSGLLLNCSTLEIQADYTRYSGIHLDSTITVHWQSKPGRFLKERLYHYMRPKCHPIFYDSNINSASVVRLNIYQAFLLCAMKLHCYICDLSSICTLHAQYYFEMIKNSFRYMYKLIVGRMLSLNLGSNVRPILKLKKAEVEWLGLKAFIRVLKRKQSRYVELLSLLRSELLTSDIIVNASLKYAVDDSHSSIFWKFNY